MPDKQEKWRNRKMRLLLYPDDSSHASALEIIKNSGYQYAGILHDMDKKSDDDSGEIPDDSASEYKKPHWHIVIKFPQARWNTAFADELGITNNYIRPCANLDGALKYLIHDTDPDKYQYDLDQVFGPLKTYLATLLVSDDEGSRVLQIVQMIDDVKGYVSYRDLLVKACNDGLYSDFRRLGAGVKMLIDEHNSQYRRDEEIQTIRALDQSQFNRFVSTSGNIPFDTRCDILYKAGYPPLPLEGVSEIEK